MFLCGEEIKIMVVFPPSGDNYLVFGTMVCSLVTWVDINKTGWPASPKDPPISPTLAETLQSYISDHPDFQILFYVVSKNQTQGLLLAQKALQWLCHFPNHSTTWIAVTELNSTLKIIASFKKVMGIVFSHITFYITTNEL